MVALWTWLAGCGTPSAPPEPLPPSQALKIAGAPSLMADLVPALTDTHGRTRGSLTFETTSSSTPQALRQLLDGEVDLVAAEREVDGHEHEQAQAAGWSFTDPGVRHVVAVDVIEVRAHADNQVTSLSYDEIIGIFCQGTVNDWVFVEGPERAPMHVFAPPSPSGIRDRFADFFCGSKGLHASVADTPVERIHEKLAEDPNAIAVVSASVSQGRAMGLRPDPLGPAVMPTKANLVAGAYPLRRDVIFFSAGAAAGYARSFLDWVKSPAGQEVVDEHDYLPLFLRPAAFDRPQPLRELVHFDPGEARPNARTQARLKLLIDEIRERDLDHVVLEGFADDREDNAEALSMQRAEAVQSLLAKSVPGLTFEVAGRGADQPLMSNDTQEGRQRNRRVQVYLTATGDEAMVINTERKE
ncbi:MAG: phosphate ABC transporter substrate-binding/OmpA family protein [Myxococcota bacterium]